MSVTLLHLLVDPTRNASLVKPPSRLEIWVAESKDADVAAHDQLLKSLGGNNVVAYSDGSLMEGVAGSGVAV